MTNYLTKLNFHVNVDINVDGGHDVGHLVYLHVGHHNVTSTLCEGSETLTEWKSKSVLYLRADGLTDVGARDACAMRIWKCLKCLILKILRDKINVRPVTQCHPYSVVSLHLNSNSNLAKTVINVSPFVGFTDALMCTVVWRELPRFRPFGLVVMFATIPRDPAAALLVRLPRLALLSFPANSFAPVTLHFHQLGCVKIVWAVVL